MGKRPQGLQKAALAKKKKQRLSEQEKDKAADVSSTTTDVVNGDEEDHEDAVTFQFGEDVDPNNELESLYAIYDSYHSMNFAPKLLYLLIHTSDNILRLHSKKLEKPTEEGKEEKKDGEEVDPIDLIPEVLPAKFHNIYASSLLAMSRMVEDENEDDEEEEDEESEAKAKAAPKKDELKDSAKDFIDAGLERVETGLETYPDSHDLLFTRARGNILKVAEQLKRDTVDTFQNYTEKLLPPLNQALEDFEKAEQMVLSDSSSEKKYSEQEFTAIQLLLDIGEHIGNNWMFASMRDDGETEDAAEPEDDDEDNDQDAEYAADLKMLQDKYLDWSKERYENMAKVGDSEKGKTASTAENKPFQIQREANLGIGKYYLAKAAPYIEEYEEAAELLSDDDEEETEKEKEEDDNESSEVLRALGDKAREYMSKSVAYLLKSEQEDDGENLALIAEAQLSLANMLEDEGEQELLYKEALIRLKRAQRMGAGDFTELIRDLQQK